VLSDMGLSTERCARMRARSGDRAERDVVSWRRAGVVGRRVQEVVPGVEIHHRDVQPVVVGVKPARSSQWDRADRGRTDRGRTTAPRPPSQT